ncbi:hypothetical protein LXA43DRAFT_594825 [Ganoderma leucocontextum]|nr:hypothetical protein LXA43DRAFT_594825 [Ganoderma leucocontextum]
MGGLVLGLCLKKYAPDLDFDIYESATELTELGAGISMSPRTWSIIKMLGLGDELITTTGTAGPYVLLSLTGRATKSRRLTFFNCHSCAPYSGRSCNSS